MTKNYISTYLLLFLIAIIPSSIHAQCTFGNDIGSFDPQNNFDWAQSFTAECDGFLEYVEFITGSGGTQQARTLEIFEGATVSGEPIYTQEFPAMNFNAAGESLRINLSEEFPIANGDVFTFQIPGVTVNLLVDINDPYPGGFAFEDGGEFGQIVDFVFNVSISDEFLATENLDLMIISAYPNPSSEIIDVSLGSFHQDVTIRTYNFIGELVMEERITNTDLLRMNIASLSNGTYYSIVMTPSNRGIFRFIKT